MSSELALGIDVATAAVRVLAVDVVTGAVTAGSEVALPPPTAPGPGRLEQPPVHADVVRSALRAVTDRLGARARMVRAMAVTATSGSVLTTGPDGRPRGPVLLYADQRGGTQAIRLTTALGRPTSPASPAARLAWLAEHVAVPGGCYLHVPDLVVADLTGRLVADTSHTLKAGVDPAGARWPADLLAAAGIPATAVPDLVRPGTIVGAVRSDAATDVGLPAGVQVVAGMTDGCTAQISSGAVSPGQTTGVLGTTLVLKGVTPEEVAGYDGAVYSHLSADGLWWPGGASNCGAGILLHAEPGADLETLDGAAAALGPSPLVAYPLPGTGERFPFSRAEATGFLMSDGAASPAERHRTWLDAIAYVERLGLERLGALGVRSDDHRVVGGGTRSAVWNTIRASVLDRPVSRPAEPSSAFGAAVLAAGAWTAETLADATIRMVRLTEVIDPDPGQIGALEQGYRRLTTELHRRGWLDPTTVPPAG